MINIIRKPFKNRCDILWSSKFFASAVIYDGRLSYVRLKIKQKSNFHNEISTMSPTYIAKKAKKLICKLYSADFKGMKGRGETRLPFRREQTRFSRTLTLIRFVFDFRQVVFRKKRKNQGKGWKYLKGKSVLYERRKTNVFRHVYFYRACPFRSNVLDHPTFAVTHLRKLNIIFFYIYVIVLFRAMTNNGVFHTLKQSFVHENI